MVDDQLAKKKPKPKPKKKGSGPKINQDKIERQYGLSYALFKAFPELNSLLKQAVKGSWSAAKFQVELRQTKWFKQHSDTWRKNTALKYSDPASYQQRLDASVSSVSNLARSVGVSFDTAGLQSVAEQALLFGWDEGQTRDYLANYVKPSDTGDYGGSLASVQQSLEQTAYRNGIKLSDSQVQGWMQAIVRGDASEEQYTNSIRDMAAATFNLYGDQIRSGMDLADAASPYVQSMAATLEMNPANLNLFDPTIRKALTGVKNQSTGQYEPTSITDFEEGLRKDQRWQFTQTAQDQARGYVASLRQAWGLG